MRLRSMLPLCLVVLAGGCQGTLPTPRGDPQEGYGAILVKGRVIIPTGETFRGRLAINLESDNERYVLPFLPGRTELLVVEPGKYRVHPTRGPFGFSEKTLLVGIERKTYRVPFPREILRKDPIAIRSNHVAAIGILEATLTQAPGERTAQVSVRLDDSPAARRELIEEKIAHMMDLNQPSSIRETAVRWTQALDEALVEVQADEGRRAPYKPGRF